MLTSLLRTVAAAAVLSVLLLISFQKAHAQGGTAIYNFCSFAFCTDGAQPAGSLVSDQYGNLYGTTQSGGNAACDSSSLMCVGGTIFELSPEPAGGCASGTSTGNGWCEQVLYNFCSAGGGYPAWPDCADGASPTISLTLVRTGTPYNPIYNIYGTTFNGGGSTCYHGCGIAFELSPEPLPIGFGCPSGTNQGNGWCEKVLYNFCSLTNCTDGGYPGSGLVRDSSGNLYGANTAGVFKLSENSGVWNEAVIYSVNIASLFWSTFINYDGLAIDAKGSLYGADNVEHIFKLSNLNGQWVATNIHTFMGAPLDGSYPHGTPAVDSAGNVYGTTVTGGSLNYGTVWKLSPVTKGTLAGTYKERILHSFTSAKTGLYPLAGVTLDSSGNIYGTTEQGGAYYTICTSASVNATGCGTVFELAPSSSTYTYKLLWSFDFWDGAFPLDNPIVGSSGKLYGTTYGGINVFNGGTVFEVNLSGAATTTTLTSSPNPATVGESVTFTATVSSSAGTPAEGDTVNFMKGSTWLGSGTLSGGQASFTTSTLPLGTSSVNAVYNGDLNFAPSTSNTVKEVVEK